MIPKGTGKVVNVKLTNVGTEVFVDRCGGSDYVLDPGETVIVARGVAQHFAGDPKKLGSEDSRESSEESERVKDRNGGKVPTLEIKEMAPPKPRPEKKPEIVAVEVVKDDTPEFPELETVTKSKKGKKKVDTSVALGPKPITEDVVPFQDEE